MALTSGQKLCLFFIMLASLAIMVGSVAPYWAVLEGALGSKLLFGVWFFCADGGEKDCDHYGWASLDADDFDALFFVFHVLEGLATLLALILAIISLAKICCNARTAMDAVGLGLCTGAMGVAAAVMGYVKMADSLANGFVDKDDAGWAFYVSISGSCLMLVLSIILLLLRGPTASGVV